MGYLENFKIRWKSFRLIALVKFCLRVMLKKLNNITVIFLLVVFSISAIGLNISVHKCKLKGSTHFNFFSKTYNSNELTCGCKVEENIPTTKELAPSCCGKSNNEDDISECNETHKKDNNYVGNQLLEASCCSDSNISYMIGNDFTFSEKINVLYDISLAINSIEFEERSYSVNTSDNSTKVQDYPIKELLCRTISFIHFSSLSVSNSEEAPIHKC